MRVKRILAAVPLIWACLLGASAWADLAINAEVNKTSVALNDQIVLAITVSGPNASLPDPQMPPLPNFSVYSSGRNQSISFVNGSVASSVVHTYVLVPHFVGKGTIDPVSITVSGKTVKTDPIEILVQPPGPGGATQSSPSASKKAAAQPSGGSRGPDVFITAEVDKKKPFVNEQIILTVKFYTGISLMGNPQYSAPKISGFISEDLPPERHGNVALHGRTYYYSEIKTALFPAQAGKLNIGPATVRCQIQQDVAVDPFSPDFFQKFFSQGLVTGQARDLSSDPLLVTAEPLPEAGKPANFSGAVGAYSISAAVDRNRVKVGEAVNLTITVGGTGNLKAIGEPQKPEMPSFRVYDTVSSMNLDKKNDLVRGSKVFKTVLVPRVSGSLTIPPISFSYFDPAKRAYAHTSTLPISLNVAPGDPGQTPEAYTAQPPGQEAPRGLTAVTQDIRYIKTRPASASLPKIAELLTGLGALHSLPLLVFAGLLAWTGYQSSLGADKKGTRFRGAYKSAMNKIKEASQAAKDPHRFSSLMSDALTHYLADKLHQPASGLTLKRVQEILQRDQPHLSGQRLDRIKNLWEEFEHLRFAPSSGNGHNASLADEMARLFKDLEREIQRK